MITLKQFMEVVEYRITEGSDYLWRCFGDNAYSLSSWNEDYDGHSLNLTFDTKTQEVYMADVCDYSRSRAYRLINPAYRDAYKAYARKHNEQYANQAWDDVNYIDLETTEDFMSKSRTIVEDRDYDLRVQVPLDLADDELFRLMTLAHERDITLNQMVEQILREVIEREGVKV